MQSINAGETKTIAFTGIHTDAEGKDLGYSVIVANATDLFPVKIVDLPAAQDSFAATTVTKEDVALLKGAENFQQVNIAFPSSDMAAGFTDVVTNGDAQAIASYLAGFPSYGAITIDTIAAVQTYYNRYGIVWAGKDGVQSYNLFTSNDTDVIYLGQLAVSYQSEGSVTDLQSPAGFTASFTDAEEKTTNLYYANGQFSEDVNNAAPAICLQGLFILKSQLTTDSADSKIEPVVYGGVNGNEIFGCTDQHENTMSAASVTDDIKNFFDPEGLVGWCKLAGAVLGLLASIGISVLVAWYIIKKGVFLSKQELIKRNRQAVQDTLSRMNSKVRSGLEIPEDITMAIDIIKHEAEINLLHDSKVKISEILQKQGEMHNALLDFGNPTQMEIVYDNIYSDVDLLSDITPAGLATKITDVMGRIDYNTDILTTVAKKAKASKKLKAEQQDVIDKSSPIVNECSKAVKENEDIREDLLEDRVPEFEA